MAASWRPSPFMAALALTSNTKVESRKVAPDIDRVGQGRPFVKREPTTFSVCNALHTLHLDTMAWIVYTALHLELDQVPKFFGRTFASVGTALRCSPPPVLEIKHRSIRIPSRFAADRFGIQHSTSGSKSLANSCNGTKSHWCRSWYRKTTSTREVAFQCLSGVRGLETASSGESLDSASQAASGTFAAKRASIPDVSNSNNNLMARLTWVSSRSARPPLPVVSRSS